MSLIYPNEAWPADSAVAAVDGTVDAVTGLPFIAKGTGPTSSPSYEIQYNRRQIRENRILAGWRQGMVVDESGLEIGVYPIAFTLGGQRLAFDGASGVSVPDDASRVVYLNASAVLQVAADWPGELASYLPLASVVTASGQMSITDRRGWSAFEVPAAARRTIGFGPIDVASSQSDVKLFAFDAAQDLALEEVQVFCTAVSSAASVTVRRSDAVDLAGAAVPVAGSVVTPTVAEDEVADTQAVAVHVTTDGSGSISNLHVLLSFRVV